MICVCAVLFAGCSHQPLDLYDPSLRKAADSPGAFDDQSWTNVLRDNVRNDRVDYDHLAAHPEDLEKYLEHVAYVGPQMSPDLFKQPGAALAYYLNTYNACVLASVLAENAPRTMHDVRKRTVEHGYRFRVDGQIVTPGDLRSLARAASEGNARVEFAMCDAAIGSPALSAQPYRPNEVVEQLRRDASAAMDNARMVQVDHETQRLLVAVPIWSQREQFLEMYRRETGSRSATMLNCLMHMANPMRREYFARAAGYEVRLLPFDRALNHARR